MFRPNRPSSGLRVVVVKDSAARCNMGFFPATQLPLVTLVMGVARANYSTKGTSELVCVCVRACVCKKGPGLE
jgi:hypothetical protein